KLLKNGCYVYAIHNNILHGKALMVDRKWLTLGSYNFHFTSQFFNVEANIETTDESVLKNFHLHFFDTALSKSTPMDLAFLRKQENFFSKIRNFLAYQFSMILHAFYMAHSKINLPE
ncbi:MAG: phospholipase D-like domain-containing protein, partial [Bdellovibrionota bacterium]